MSNYNINSNPTLVREMIEIEKKASEEIYKKQPDSLIPLFDNELRKLGYEFEVSSQALGFLPKHKDVILPLAIKFYGQAKYDNEKNHFLSFFHHKGFDEVVPLLLEDYYSLNTHDSTLWFISACLYQIRSKAYVDDYIKIISNPKFGINRQMVVLLVGSLKIEKAIPTLTRLLEDEDVKSHAITALGAFKKVELRPHFERFLNDKRPLVRKEAKKALNKVGK